MPKKRRSPKRTVSSAKPRKKRRTDISITTGSRYPKRKPTSNSRLVTRVKKPPSGLSGLSESELEQNFLHFLVANGHKPVQQHMFHPTRQWRFDFCWPDKKLAIEIQGWAYHHTYLAMSSDYEKHNAALLLGWRILYFMSHDLNPYIKDNTLATIRSALNAQT